MSSDPRLTHGPICLWLSYPKKQVTVVQSSKRLLSDPWPTKLSDRLESDLKKMGANIIFGQRVASESLSQQSGIVTLADGRTLEADLIFPTAGTTPNSQLVAAQAPTALNARGYVKVDDYLRVCTRSLSWALCSSSPVDPL
jgi:pyruvate/2-oxoglutarate dehydrogenase complex dihydrolipoamide dehydrogenase (E3) component